MLPCVKGEMGCASEGYNLQTYICTLIGTFAIPCTPFYTPALGLVFIGVKPITGYYPLYIRVYIYRGTTQETPRYKDTIPHNVWKLYPTYLTPFWR
jgi:hypothetical protein